MDEEIKNPEEYAKKQVNKILGEQIAKRLIKIKEHEATIKQLRREIEKIKNGELVDETPCSPSCYNIKPLQYTYNYENPRKSIGAITGHNW